MNRKMVTVVAGLWSLSPAPGGCLTVCAQWHSPSPQHPFPHPSMQTLQAAVGMSRLGTERHTAGSCPRADSAKLREGRRRENMGFLPRFMLSSCPLCPPSSSCQNQHLCSQENSNLALPPDEALTLCPPASLFSS